MQRNSSASACATGSHRRESPRPPWMNTTAGPLPSSSTQSVTRRRYCASVDLEHVLVVGAGQMGSGIAQVVAASGRRVSLHDPFPGAVERGLAAMRTSLTKLAEKGGADPEETLGRVVPADDLVPADLLIEAVTEDAGAKEALLRQADDVVPAGA